MAGLGMWPSAGIYKMPSINTAGPQRENTDSHNQTRMQRRGFANRGDTISQNGGHVQMRSKNRFSNRCLLDDLQGKVILKMAAN
jgi:hypothetical protein